MENKQWDVSIRFIIEGTLTAQAKDSVEAYQIANNQCHQNSVVITPTGSKWEYKTRKTIWATKESKKKKV